MPWGVEDLTKGERFAKSINAGVDQIGGTEEANFIVEDVHAGTISEARVRETASRILRQKFALGLFELVELGGEHGAAGRPVLGVDTAVVLGDEVFGKPAK